MASTIVAPNTIVVELLNQHNYKDWSSRLGTYLLAKDLWDVIIAEPPEVENGEAEYQAWRRKNARALHAIKISCGTEIFSFIRRTETAKEAWEILEFKSLDRLDEISSYATACSPEQTHLHKAATQGDLHIMKELLASMRVEDLIRRDSQGRTALDVIIVASYCEEDSIRMARYMVEKNSQIVRIRSPPYGYLPVVSALSLRKWKMARYLSSVTPVEALLERNGISGAQLITMCIQRSQLFDVACNLLRLLPSLALADNGFGEHPMVALVGMRTRCAICSGARLTFWQKLIYNGIHIQPVELNVREIHIDVSESEDELCQKKKSEDDQVTSLFRRLIKDALELLGINHLYEMKSNHVGHHDLLSSMLELAKCMDNLTSSQFQVVRKAVFHAIEHGHVEFVTHMWKVNPALIDIVDEKDMNIFQYAITCRREEIYNSMYELNPTKRGELIGHCVRKSYNNMLHSAADLSPFTRRNYIQNASLQMQRELQWFKEVESILPVEIRERANIAGLTGRELFTKSHEKLKEEAERSMKGTATSCTTIGALIVTIMFAVAFTVPGGTNGNTGLPLLMHKKLFKVFILSDTISLVSSATSVITFLGILTSRYEEEDFLWLLPSKMMIGLSTLFISIVAMMIVFSCALIIVLDGKAKMITLGIVFASVPVVSFVLFLFPLIFNIGMSTYGPSIFLKKAIVH